MYVYICENIYQLVDICSQSVVCFKSRYFYIYMRIAKLVLVVYRIHTYTHTNFDINSSYNNIYTKLQRDVNLFTPPHKHIFWHTIPTHTYVHMSLRHKSVFIVITFALVPIYSVVV